MRDKGYERQKEHFENISKTYFEARQNEKHLLYKKLMWGFFFKKTKKFFIKKSYICLEPMCGYAEGYEILTNLGNINIHYYKGFDYSEEMVRIAKEKYQDLNIVHGNILEYKDDNKYDLVILIGGLHHVCNHVDIAIDNLSRVMQRGALFISFEPTHNNILFKKIRERIYKSHPFFDDENERGFELKELNDLFIKHGFEKLEQIYPGLLGYVLYYNPDAFKKLNIGNKSTVNLIFNIENKFYDNFIGKYLSFATLSLWRKK